MSLPVQPVISVDCEGTPFEMGVMQGTALRNKITAAFETVDRLEAFRLMKPALVPFGLFRRIAENKAEQFVSAALQRVPLAAAERLRGIAQGAQVPLRKLALCCSLEAVLSDLSPSTATGLHAGCTAVAVTRSASASGSPMLAHNFDYLPVTQPFYFIRRCNPAQGFRTVEFSLAPLSGTVDGINEAGLAIVCNYAYATDHGEPAPTITMLIAEALLRYRTVDEATAFLRETPRIGGGLLMLGDADGNIRSVEISSTRLECRKPHDEQDRLYHTNKYCCPPTCSIELHPASVYNHRAPRVMRGRRVHRSAERRNASLESFLHQTDPLDREGLLRVMSNHGERGTPSGDTVCMHGDYWHTTASLQLFPHERELRASFSPACIAEFADFRIGETWVSRVSSADAGGRTIA